MKTLTISRKYTKSHLGCPAYCIDTHLCEGGVIPSERMIVFSADLHSESLRCHRAKYVLCKDGRITSFFEALRS